MNPHPRDARVQFDIETHTYSIDGSSEGVTSVTTLLADYFPKFNPDEIIDKNYLRWQQNKYKKPECYKKSKEEIKEMWRVAGEEAAKKGTLLHEGIEAFYNKTDISYDETSEDWKQFLVFQKNHNLIAFQTEMVLWSIDHKLGGTVDLLVKNQDGTFTLYDWKRSKHSVGKNQRNWGRYGFGPLAKLPAIPYYKYSVQLNLYREIIERYYDYQISSMYVVRFHPEAKSFEMAEIDRLEEETDALLNLRREQVIASGLNASSESSSSEGEEKAENEQAAAVVGDSVVGQFNDLAIY